MKVSIVIPCFNEFNRLPVNEFKDYLLIHNHIHFLFVDDGSTDNTILRIKELIEAFPQNISLHRLETNKGKAEAVRIGVLKSMETDNDFIGFIDADLATPVQEIDILLNVLKNNPQKKIVIGSRIQLLGNIVNKFFIRYLIGRFFATCAALTLKLPVYDTQCGLKIFSKQICAQVFNETFLSRWLFDVEIFARLINIYGREKTIEMSFEQPVSKWIEKGESKVKLGYFFKAPFELLRIRRYYFFKKRLELLLR